MAAEVLFASDLNQLNTNILNNALSLISPLTGNLAAGDNDITGLDELQFTNAAADPTAGTTPRLRNNAGTFKVRVQDARTATTARPFGVIADTSGAPAASLGVGVLFEAESADEVPSSFGALDFVASDIGAGTEDTDLVIMARTAGAALAEVGRATSLGGYTPAANSTSPPAAHTLYRDNVPKFWLRCGVAADVTDSFNITSVADTGAGLVTVTIDRDFANTTYVVVGVPVAATMRSLQVDASGIAAGSFQADCFNGDNPPITQDPTTYMLAGYGDQ